MGVLRQILDTLQKMARQQLQVDRSRFNDPLAEQIQWTPAKGGGANFRTHALREVSMHRLEFRMSPGGMIFNMIFLLSGLGTMVFFGLRYHSDMPVSELLLPLLFGLVFALVGGGMLFFSARPIVFDKELGWFWKGYKKPSLSGGAKQPKISMPLHRIHALQILAEYVRSDKSSYYSYELNLVNRDGTRINVVDHGNYERLREDAQKLSDFLGAPIWDAASRS